MSPTKRQLKAREAAHAEMAGVSNDDAEDSGEETPHPEEPKSLKDRVMKLTKIVAKAVYKKEEMLDAGFEIFEGGPKGEAFAKWAQGIVNSDDEGLLHYMLILGRLRAEVEMKGE